MNAFFEWVAYLFEDIFFMPFNLLRSLADSNWFGSNVLNWIFLVVGFAAMIYWIQQLKKFDDNGEEDKEVSAHSFL